MKVSSRYSRNNVAAATKDFRGKGKEYHFIVVLIDPVKFQ
jgi:hypothetical protein